MIRESLVCDECKVACYANAGERIDTIPMLWYRIGRVIDGALMELEFCSKKCAMCALETDWHEYISE